MVSCPRSQWSGSIAPIMGSQSRKDKHGPFFFRDDLAYVSILARGIGQSAFTRKFWLAVAVAILLPSIGMTAYARLQTAHVLREANAGNIAAQIKAAEKYADGSIVRQDASQSFEWYLKAAEQGDAWAQVMVGKSLAEGIGVEPDQYGAFRWHMHAAQRGYAVAMVSVARAYYEGIGVEKDHFEFAKWILIAASRGRFIEGRNEASAIDRYSEDLVMWFGELDESVVEEGKRRAEDWAPQE